MNFRVFCLIGKKDWGILIDNLALGLCSWKFNHSIESKILWSFTRYTFKKYLMKISSFPCFSQWFKIDGGVSKEWDEVSNWQSFLGFLFCEQIEGKILQQKFLSLFNFFILDSQLMRRKARYSESHSWELKWG